MKCSRISRDLLYNFCYDIALYSFHSVPTQQPIISYLRTIPYPRHHLIVLNMVRFWGEEMLATVPNSMLEDQPLSKYRNCFSVYWQPSSILKYFNFITSSCSLSPTVMLGTPFPFPCPSIVNTFLRRTDFSPNNEIFPMRPNNLTRCIFKTKVPNEYRVDNNETIYKCIHEIKEKHF